MKLPIAVSLVSAAALVCGCVANTAFSTLPGPTLLNRSSLKLRADVLRTLRAFEAAKTDDWNGPVVLDTKIVEFPAGASASSMTAPITGHWVEQWTVQRSRSNVSYTITFNAKGTDGTSYEVRLND